MVCKNNTKHTTQSDKRLNTLLNDKYIYDHSLSWLGKGTLLKLGEDTSVLWHTSPLLVK
jgi:hypothetical protein